MGVTYSPAKDALNIKKHGVSLRRVEDFDFDTAMYAVDDSQDYGEIRYNAIGWLDAILHTLTFAQEDTSIRAISLRRATRQEQKLYAEAY